jgi:hypothetical protein
MGVYFHIFKEIDFICMHDAESAQSASDAVKLSARDADNSQFATESPADFQLFKYISSILRAVCRSF